MRKIRMKRIPVLLLETSIAIFILPLSSQMIDLDLLYISKSVYAELNEMASIYWPESVNRGA